MHHLMLNMKLEHQEFMEISSFYLDTDGTSTRFRLLTNESRLESGKI